MKTWCLAMVLASLWPVCAQGPDATFRVGGFLTDRVSGQPVRRAMVRLDFIAGIRPGPGTQSTTADAGGHFEFSGAVPGVYRVWAAKRGYELQNVSGPAGLTITADRTDLLFQMEPSAVLTGAVVDENNDAIAGATVQLVASVIEAGRRELRPSVSTRTDDRGRYRLASLPPGRYYVSAYAGSQEASEQSAYIRRFYPNAANLQSALAVELRSGEAHHADFRLEPEAIHHVRGKVVGGEKLTGVSVALAPRNSAEQFGGVTYAVQYLGEGRFDISGVPAGQYTLSISGYEGNVLERALQPVAMGASDVEGLTIALQPGAALSGHLSVERLDGVPPLEPHRISIQLLAEDSIRDAGVALGVEGEHVLSKNFVTPGNYFLSATVPPPYYVKSASLGGIDALAGVMNVPGSGGLPLLEMAIGARGGVVSGTVKFNGKPAARCLVMLIRNGSATQVQDRLAQTDQDGKFVMAGVAPGQYMAYAWRNIQSVEFRNPEALQGFSGAGVTMEEGGKQTVELTLNLN